jgi:hypothetical protein
MTSKWQRRREGEGTIRDLGIETLEMATDTKKSKEKPGPS